MVTTRFLVAADESATPDLAHLRKALPDTPLAQTARALLGSPQLTIDAASTAPTRWSPRLLRLGGVPDGLQRVIKARHHILVHSTAAPSDQPRHAQAARLVARVLATVMSGDLVDLDSSQLLSTSTEPDRFVLGDEWIGVFVALAEGRDAEHCVRAGTAGMHRFGLPEIMATEVPYGHMLTAANILRALAFRLLSDGALSRNHLLDPDDLLRFWGAHPAYPAKPRHPNGPDQAIRADQADHTGDAGEVGRAGDPGYAGEAGHADDAGQSGWSSGLGRLRLRLAQSVSDCPGCDAGVEVVPPTWRGDPVWWEGRAGAAMPKLVSA
ncbi:hypothetical protein ACGFNU_36625 [Spirillospora sp. NPDC048911]|uniref:hypothetical protein n=1 Tax=Spirillospora sp. NPDC048911 TaxID=3364527 RepID=UPI00371108F3